MRETIKNDHIAMVDDSVWDNVKFWVPTFNPIMEMENIIKRILKQVPDTVPSGKSIITVEINCTEEAQVDNLNFLGVHIRRRRYETEAKMIMGTRWNYTEDKKTGKKRISKKGIEIEVNLNFFNAIHYALEDGVSEDYLIGQLEPFCGLSGYNIACKIIDKAKRMKFDGGDHVQELFSIMRELTQNEVIG